MNWLEEGHAKSYLASKLSFVPFLDYFALARTCRALYDCFWRSDTELLWFVTMLNLQRYQDAYRYGSERVRLWFRTIPLKGLGKSAAPYIAQYVYSQSLDEMIHAIGEPGPLDHSMSLRFGAMLDHLVDCEQYDLACELGRVYEVENITEYLSAATIMRCADPAALPVSPEAYFMQQIGSTSDPWKGRGPSLIVQNRGRPLRIDRDG